MFCKLGSLELKRRPAINLVDIRAEVHSAEGRKIREGGDQFGLCGGSDAEDAERESWQMF